jgi:hypothetical protein
MTLFFTSIGAMMALTPSTSAILKILEPMALPMLSPDCWFSGVDFQC